MNQTSVIAAALIVAFVVFITVRGELPGYLSVFTGTNAPPATSTAATTGAVAETAKNFIGKDPVQYPFGGIGMPSPWGSGSDFGFGGGGSGFDSPPGVFPL